MKNPISRLVPISLLIAMIVALLPIPVYAAPAVTSITPSSIVNDVANVITVAGMEFDETAAVLMDGSALVTKLSEYPNSHGRHSCWSYGRRPCDYCDDGQWIG